MSKDDFRDRLKSYSSEPEHGEWVKMQQLLDADKDDRKVIAWWKYAGLFVLLLIPVILLLFNGSAIEGHIDGDINSNSSKNITTESFSVSETQKELNTEVITAESVIEEDLSSQVNGTEKSKDTNSVSKRQNKSNQKNKNGKNLKSTNSNSTRVNAILSRPQANNASQFKTSNFKVEIPGPILVDKAEQFSSTDVVLAFDQLDQLDLAYFDLDERKLPELEQSPFIKAYPTKKHNPWYLVSGIGVKYPIVDVSNAEIGSLIPEQKFFPSYTAEVGVGKHLGKFSVEGGVAGSLYQYKLGKMTSELQWGTQQNGVGTANGTEASNGDISGSTFIVNKFALVSPYLRAQYSIDLKKNYKLGLHSMVNFNRRINLKNQLVSDQFAADNNGSTIEISGRILDGAMTNINYDFGFSIEKQLAKRGRIAMDFSYSLASGILEEGSYSVLRETTNETNGVYSISGIGPMVKLRYYLSTLN